MAKSTPYHVYSEGGYESAHSTETAAIVAASKAANGRRATMKVFKTGPYGRTGSDTGTLVASIEPSTSKPRRAAPKKTDPFLTLKQVDALINKLGADPVKFWDEAGGGDRVPMPKSVALRIIGTL